MEKKYMGAIGLFTDSVNEALQALRIALNEKDNRTNNGRNIFALSLAYVRMIAQAGLANVVFHVGDIIISEHEICDISWRVIGVGDYDHVNSGIGIAAACTIR